MSFNSDTFALMVKFGLAMIAVLMIIWLLACATPFLAKIADKLLGKAKIDQGASSVPAESPERVEDKSGSGGNGAEEKSQEKPAEYRVYDIYEGSPPEDNDNEKKE